MLLFSINFNLYYLILRRRMRDVLSSSELWCFLGIVAVSVGAITVNIGKLFPNFWDALRHGAFQVASIISTTGFATTDFDQWPSLAKAILLVLMFIGACAGSTGGGLKVSRVIILFRSAKRQLTKLLHPRSVGSVKFEGKALDNDTLSSTKNYFAIYMFSFFILFLLISFEPFDMETNFSAVAACFNNIGPGFGAVGPTRNFAEYSIFSKWVLSFAMLLGRLEIFPLLLAFSPSSWRKSK